MDNPLKSVDPNEIDNLINKDPLELTEEETDANVQALILMLRKEREVWQQEKAAEKITGKRVSGNRTKKLQQEEARKALLESGSAKIDIGDILG